MPSRKKPKPKKPRPPAEAPVPSGFLPWERRCLCGIVLLGLLLRWAGKSGLAVEHFDEGVYASNLYCGHLDPQFAYPMRHLYAPPLFPALLEWSQVFWGAQATMWVNVLFGGLTVVAVWYATRCWFGRSAALAAAMLAATNEYHIAFSRMALTDVPLSLFLLLGVFAGWRAILSGRPVWIAAAGLLAGLAWCTKYNGWLTLAITGSGTLAWLLFRDCIPKLQLRGSVEGPAATPNPKISDFKSEISNLKLGSAVARWGLTAAIAGAIFWVFVVRELEPLGGYAAVAKNHAGYFVGVGGWWSGLLRQGAAQDLLMSWPTCIGIAIAWWMCGVIGLLTGGDRGDLRRWIVVGLCGVALALAGRLLTASGLLAVVALVGFVCIQSQRVVRDDDGMSSGAAAANLAAWLLCAWFFGLLVSVPLYYPYPRLSVPWVVVCWPLAGAAISALSARLVGVRRSDGTESLDVLPPEGGTPKANRKPLAAAGAAVVVMIGLLIAFDRARALPQAWQSRVLIEGIAQSILQEIESSVAVAEKGSESGVAAVVYVEGDPAAYYQLSVANRDPKITFQPIAESTGLRPTPNVPTFLVSRETVADRGPDVANRNMLLSNRFTPSDMVLLDRLPASEVRKRGVAPTDQILLFQIEATPRQ